MSTVEQLRTKFERWSLEDRIKHLEGRLRLRERHGPNTLAASVSLSLLRRRLREAKERLAELESGERQNV